MAGDPKSGSAVEVDNEEKEKGYSFLEGFLARLRHPFFGTFAFTWVIYNWDALYLLLTGREKYQDTITFLWNNCFTFNNTRFLVHPLWTTAVVLIVGPITRKGYKLAVAWIYAKMDSLRPVSGYDYDILTAQYKNLENQKNAISNAYSTARATIDPNGRILDLTQQMENWMNQYNTTFAKLVALEADNIPGEKEKRIGALMIEVARLTSVYERVKVIVQNLRMLNQDTLGRFQSELLPYTSQNAAQWQKTKEVYDRLTQVKKEIEDAIAESNVILSQANKP
jgi:hypothetical protein